jgi:biopolymer transport protein ExbD
MTIGPDAIASIDALSERLAEVARINPQVRVILRADRRLPYGKVREVMEIVASHQLRRLQVVTELD